MIIKEYIKNFEKLGFGMFVHFGLYSIVGKGEWYHNYYKIDDKEYQKLINSFSVDKNWSKELVKIAKRAGCKYITITTRHHDGFSLYDTKGLNNYDAPHSLGKRDIIKEFVDECNKNDILPFFYHTLLDWDNEYYENDFSKYLEYLRKSIKLLCTNYGKIGGFWFDGMWDKPNEDWEEDKLYTLIRKYQPEAMIINNTGLSELGKVGHYEIDSVTFERGNPCFVDNSDKYRAGEMCQTINDHWGYAKNDCNYKSTKELIENLVDCRKYNCNFLLNVGLLKNGLLPEMGKAIFDTIGNWININGECIYDCKNSDIEVSDKDCFILKNSNNIYYLVCKNVGMQADPNVTRNVANKRYVNFIIDKVKDIEWLDNGKVEYIKNDNKIEVLIEPFPYGTSLSVRVAKIEIGGK